MSKTRNPAYIALNKKGDQIKRSRYQGMAGIFLLGIPMKVIGGSGLMVISVPGSM